MSTPDRQRDVRALPRKKARPMQRELTEQERAVYTVLESKLKMVREDGVAGAGITRRTERFAISDPIVYRVPDTDTVFVFSSTSYGYDIRALQEQMEKLRKIQAEQADAVDMGASGGEDEPGTAVSLAEAVPSEEDVTLLMNQAGVSQEKAERALSENGNDVIKALSMLIE